jgi:hypothetical protein
VAGEGGVGQCHLFGLGKYKARRWVNSYTPGSTGISYPHDRKYIGGLVATPVKQMKRHLYINNVHFMKSIMLTRKIIKGRYAVILKIIF